MKAFFAWIKSWFVKPEPPIIKPLPTPVQLPLPERIINRATFFSIVKRNFGPLTQPQVDGFNAILLAWELSHLTDFRWLAYMFATAWHETAHKMQAIKEFGLGDGHAYGKIDPVTGFAYYGRGLVQLTWDYNYKKMGKLLDLPLYENPDLALQLDIAIKIMIEGMTKGDFTGKALGDYFNDKLNDPVGARHIINGKDKDVLISSYHYKFLDAIVI